MNQKKIGLFMRTLRQEKSLTQEAVSEYFGVTSRTISRWETGYTMPDISMLIEIADFYCVDVRELLDGERKEKMNDDINTTTMKLENYSKKLLKRMGTKLSFYSGMACFASLVCQFVTDRMFEGRYNIQRVKLDICYFIIFIGTALTIVVMSGALI